jgi:dihydrofolate reductase
MACIYYTASSLDGFIADEHASLEWLLTRDITDDGPFAIEPFVDSVGALVMGADTYEWILAHQPGDWMYSQPSWVMTHRPQIIADGHPVQTFAGAVTDLMPTLLDAAGERHVWVMGGGRVARQFVDAGLIDEMIVSYAPCTLGAGSPVLPGRSEWRLVDTARNGDFVCAHWRRV